MLNIIFSSIALLAQLNLVTSVANSETDTNAANQAIEECRSLQPVYPGAVFPDPTCWNTLDIPTWLSVWPSDKSA